MSVGTYPQIALMSYGPSSSGRYMKVMIGFSLALHVLALLFISGLRLPGKMEWPLAASLKFPWSRCRRRSAKRSPP